MIVVSLFALIVGAFIMCLIAWGIFAYFKVSNGTEEAAKANQQQVPPEPRVEERPWQQLINVRAREEHVLSSYAWVDQKEGTVRIPISQAIDELVKKGLPSHDYLSDMVAGKKPPAAAPAARTATPKQQGSSNGKK